jgi:hypothetical protein
VGGASLTSAGAADLLVARLSSAGAHTWSQRYGDASSQAASAVAVGPNDEVFVAGENQGSIDFGGGALTTAGARDVFFARLSSGGGHLWSKGFGDASNQYAASIAVDANGYSMLLVQGAGTIDFGLGPLTSAGSYDVFLARFAP